jgi:hypothetical protein
LQVQVLPIPQNGLQIPAMLGFARNYTKARQLLGFALFGGKLTLENSIGTILEMKEF